MAGDETVGKCSQALTGVEFPSSRQATRTRVVTTRRKAGTFSHPAVNTSVAFLQTCYVLSLNTLVIPHTLVKVFSFQENQLLHSRIFLLNPVSPSSKQTSNKCWTATTFLSIESQGHVSAAKVPLSKCFIFPTDPVPSCKECSPDWRFPQVKA